VPLSIGTRLGPYEILSALGAGGMGEVYRAYDTKLKRDVAIKVLPDLFANDPERLARFQREAQVLASLNHPNIAHIHGLEESNGTRALVMELVEGPTLADRIESSLIPLAETVSIAKQIAEALEAAHEQGVIHRDLKPANIKVRPDGTVKVLDFGLAKAIEPASALSAGSSQSPTVTTPAMTHAGMILGTAAYMSPEQARGKPVDRRADVWAFGCVLYEMLTARRAFGGDEVTDTLAIVLTKEPDWSLLAATIPPALRRLLRRCLDKDLRRRLQTIGEARIQLEDVLSGTGEDAGSATGPVTPVVSRTRERVAGGAAAVFALLAAGAIAWALRPVPAPFETRLEITTPATDDPISLALSPDGRRLVFVASATGGPSQLWLRPLDQATAQPLAGTESAAFPFWSPDSRSVAFFSGTQLKRLDIGSGLPRTLARSGGGSRGGSWSADGVIVFAHNSGQLVRVPATGGVPAAVTTLTQGQISHRFPHFLPSGRQFLFNTREASAGLYLGSLDSAQTTRLAAADTNALFVPPNWLLFLRQGTLVAQHVDLTRGALTGDPLSIADDVAFDLSTMAGAFSVSSAKSIAYRTSRIAPRQFTWFDRQGKAVGSVGQPDTNDLLQPMLSTDGRRVVASRTFTGNTDLWQFDGTRMIHLTFDPTRETSPVWSPDGNRIAFSKGSQGPLSIYLKASSGAGQEELLLARPNNGLPMSWSPDGRFLLYNERTPEGGLDVWILPTDGKQKPYPFLESRFDERNAQFSPDGRWVAYQSDESGPPEIYVRPFPARSGQWQVSTMGGVTPRWRRDGKELYFIAPDAKLMAVPVATAGTAPEIGTSVALFQPNILFGGTSPVGIGWQYDVAPDGRFLINVRTGDGGTAPITVIQNWTPKN
jgi:Tol biopolymer transport system component